MEKRSYFTIFKIKPIQFTKECYLPLLLNHLQLKLREMTIKLIEIWLKIEWKIIVKKNKNIV